MSAKEQTPPEEELKEQPLISHLVELRDRILHALIAVIVVFLAMVYWANDIFEFVAVPLTSVLDPDVQAQVLRPMDAFMVPFKLTFMIALFICVPYILHQAWAFISPGLYRHEIRVTFPILVSTVILFYTGIAFSYFVILGFVFEFLVSIAPDSVTVAPDIGAYLSLVTSLCLAFGLVFEIPVAIVLLVISGVVTPAWLVEKRQYAIITNFGIAMLVTPADPYSMIMMAIPMCLLYEAGIIASRLFYRPGASQEADATE
ncbi:MAG TPA: twin-arginine translocase subunit TatC [Pseudomonadales bacterium]